MNHPPIRHAATIIITRNINGVWHLLMGQRGAAAAFMPNKFVFPGGAVDDADYDIALAGLPNEICLKRLAENHRGCTPTALLSAAIRETWEETGLRIGQRSDDIAPWPGFSDTGLAPSATSMRFVFRAITPLNNSRRFDARFFMLDAAHLGSDPDDFSKASDELQHLQWVAFEKARELDLPFITEIVLAEITSLVGRHGPPASVPFFQNEHIPAMLQRIP